MAVQGVLLICTLHPFHATLCVPCSDAGRFTWPLGPDPQGTTESTPSQHSGGFVVRTEDHLYGSSMLALAQAAPATFREQHSWDTSP